MSHRLSMSRSGVAHICAWAFSPNTPTPPDTAGKAAKIGSVTHALVEAQVNGKSNMGDVDPTILSEALAIYQGPLKEYIASRKWSHCEIGLRYDAETDTAVSGPRRGEPGYGDVAPSVLPGTLDLVAIDGDVALVEDLKTGAPPDDAEQLYCQAVAVSRRFGVSSVRVRYLRALKTKIEHLNEEVLDADRLDAEAGRISKLLRSLPMAKPNKGDAKHCWKCPARTSTCPLWNSAANDVDDDEYERRLYADGVRLF